MSSSHRLPSNNSHVPPPSGSQRRTKPASPGAAALSSVLKKVALVGLAVMALWWIYVWKSGVVQDFFDPNDPIHASRPGFRYVEPYSDKHRYRPAASPIIKEKLKNGKINHRGKYT